MARWNSDPRDFRTHSCFHCETQAAGERVGFGVSDFVALRPGSRALPLAIAADIATLVHLPRYPFQFEVI
jgi:hypothetical protein